MVFFVDTDEKCRPDSHCAAEDLDYYWFTRGLNQMTPSRVLHPLLVFPAQEGDQSPIGASPEKATRMIRGVEHLS